MMSLAERARVTANELSDEAVRLLLKYGRHAERCMSNINGSCYCMWEELKPELERRASEPQSSTGGAA